MLRKIISSFALAFSNIRSNIFHTILSVLGIVIGVGALVSILSLIDGMEEFARDQISQTTSLNAIVIQSEPYESVNSVRLRKDSIAVIDHNDYVKLTQSLSKIVKPFIWTSSSDAVIVQGKTIGALIVATGASFEPGPLSSHAGFSEEQMNSSEITAFVNTAFINAAKFESNKKSIGREIVYKGRSLKITGVVTEDKNEAPKIYFPITHLTAQELKDSPAQLLLEAAKTEEIPALKEEISSWLKQHYKHATSDFKILTNEFRIEQAARGFLLFRVIMGLIVGISVVVGGIGVMNVLLISVTERTAEIGIRKAVGANRRDIILLFLSESITVSAFGSFLGLIFGVGATMIIIPIVKAITKVPFQAAYTLNTFLIISIISLLIGIIFGTYPALRASRLDPVEAIRHE
ncbi:MAG TPA: ABC transporter permease [Chryseolinea sp.]|nr:ABC transporter permease [Chryseolinea sp.]